MKSLDCKSTRRWLQERRDREEPPGDAAAAREAEAGGPPQPSALDRAAEAHLERCADCRRFRDFLRSYGRELSAALEAAWGRQPAESRQPAEGAAVPGRPAAVSARSGRAAARGPRRAVTRGPGHTAARWALPAAAAALLAVASGALVPRLAADLLAARTGRRIRAETEALVELLYSRPLADGVEAGLAGGGLLDGLREGLPQAPGEEDGLQGLGLWMDAGEDL